MTVKKPEGAKEIAELFAAYVLAENAILDGRDLTRLSLFAVGID